LLAEEAAHEAVRLGALKAQSNAMRERLQLLAGLRLIPSLHVIRQDMDVRGWVMDFLTVLEEHEVPIEAVEALQAILQSGLAWPHWSHNGSQPQLEAQSPAAGGS
jgi:hypothetical protein